MLRKAMKAALPPEIVWREKRGLRSPESGWPEERGDGSRLSGTLTNVVDLHLWDEQFVRGCRPGWERPVG